MSDPASTTGPAAKAGQRSTRSPEDEPLAQAGGGVGAEPEHPQRFGVAADVPTRPSDAPREVQELAQEVGGWRGGRCKGGLARVPFIAYFD